MKHLRIFAAVVVFMAAACHEDRYESYTDTVEVNGVSIHIEEKETATV